MPAVKSIGEMSRSIFLVAVIMWFTILPVMANPTPLGSPGTSLVPFSLKSIKGISIAEERLTIKDGMKGKIPSPAPGGTMDVPSVEYHSWYHFNNSTGKPIKVQVGFPVIAYSETAGGSYGGFVSFRAAYGDKELSVKELSSSKSMIFPKAKLLKVLKELQTAKVTRPVAESTDFVDLTQLGKDLSSARKALRKSGALSNQQISNVLAVLNTVAFGTGDEKVTSQTLLWYSFELPLPMGLSEPLVVEYSSFVPIVDDYSFSYILSTGRFWGWRIGKLKVEIVPDSKFSKSGGTYDILPKNKFSLSKDNGHFIFERSNQPPDFDIYVKRVEH